MQHSTYIDKLWIGTKGNELWVPAPTSGPNFGRVGFSAGSTYLSGGAGKRLSKAAHKEYPMTWGHQNQDDVRPISDMKAGIYGDGLIYFIDPFAAEFNLLPMAWAFPAQACYDAPPLYGPRRPSLAQTSGNVLGYPAESAVYSYSPGGLTKELYIPIPPGYSAWVGVHGDATGTGGLWVARADGPAGYASMVDLTDPRRVIDEYNSTSGITVSVRLESGTLTLAGMIVQLYPIGITPPTGGFISGQGNSGCMFDDDPELDVYNSWYDDVVLSATLIEVGDWL